MIRIVLVAALLLTIFATASGQTTTARSDRADMPSTVAGRPTGAFFALSVADIKTSSDWYQEKLGLRVLIDGEAPNKIAKFALLERDGILIELVQRTDAKPLSAVAPQAKGAYQIHGIFKVGMVVQDIDSVYREIKKRGVPIEYELMPAKDVPIRSFSIRDNERNMIQFFGK